MKWPFKQGRSRPSKVRRSGAASTLRLGFGLGGAIRRALLQSTIRALVTQEGVRR